MARVAGRNLTTLARSYSRNVNDSDMSSARSDPTSQLTVVMAEHGLEPGDIIWDGRKHRFPGAGKKRGTAAWYFAYPDRRGAHFGDFSSGVKVHWKLHRDTPFSDREKKLFAKQKAERERELAKKREIALENVRKVWAAAEHPDPEKPHPYLSDKGIKKPPSLLRISTPTSIVNVSTKTKREEKIPAGLLLVPMYRGAKLVNLQRIHPNGRKLFFPGADPVAARHSIGVTQDTDWSLCYVCEGWATGYAINLLTNRPVIVAFTANNLRAVATAIRNRFDPGDMRLAADNDRWTKISQGEKGDDLWNVGVQYAREAAEATGSNLVIPDFKDLEGKPTDFHDLWQREGEDAARHWLAPENTEKATWLLSGAEADSADDEAPEDEETRNDTESKLERLCEDNDRFRCLGYDEDRYYFMPVGTGQVIALTLTRLATPTALLHLAPLDWWVGHVKDGKSRDDTLSPKLRNSWADALIRVCQRKGVFTMDRVRGRGFWLNDDGGLVAHFGDRLLPPGETEFVRPDNYRHEGAVYSRLGHLPGPAEHPMSLEQARDLLEIFTSLPWEEDWMGFAFAGWTVIAPFCGALPWRPHVWVAGPVSCGKTTATMRIAARLLGGTGAVFEGGSTEAGIRQQLGMDALPVVYDEPERTSRTASTQIAAVLRLMRSASSSEGRIVKGTRGGSPIAFSARSAFLLSSIGVGIEEEADRSRVTVCRLQSPTMLDPEKRRRDWEKLAPKLEEVCTTDNGRRLLARTLEWFQSGRMQELMKVIHGAASILLRDARAADQIAPLLAGVWTLMTDEVPGQEEALHWMKDMGPEAPEKPLSDGGQILNILLQAREMDQNNQLVTVGMLIDLAMEGNEPADKILRQLGFKVNLDKKELAISINSEWVKQKLKGTKYTGQWYDALRTLPGVKPGSPRQFDSKLAKQRCRTIPFDTLTKMMGDPKKTDCP